MILSSCFTYVQHRNLLNPLGSILDESDFNMKRFPDGWGNTNFGLTVEQSDEHSHDLNTSYEEV